MNDIERGIGQTKLDPFNAMSETAIHDYLTQQIKVNRNIVRGDICGLYERHSLSLDHLPPAKSGAVASCQRCKKVCSILMF